MTSTNIALRYKYNGKELNEELGLDWYDLGARMYDPLIARFMTMDPLADFINYQSPYVISDNNPIAFIDIYGLGKYRCGWLCKAFNTVLFGGKNLLPSGQRRSRISRGTGFVMNKNKPKNNRTEPNNSNSTKGDCSSCSKNLNITAPRIRLDNSSLVRLPVSSLPELQSPSPRRRNVPDFEGEPIRTRLAVPTHINFINGGLGTQFDQNNPNTNRTLNAIVKTLVDYPQLKLFMYIKSQFDNSFMQRGKGGTEAQKRARAFTRAGNRAAAIIRFLEQQGIDPRRIKWDIHPDRTSTSGKIDNVNHIMELRNPNK